jgi:flagellar motor protein MotB
VAADPNGWMNTFGDLVTLMITFFVLLFSMSSLDESTLRGSFGFFQAQTGAVGSGTGNGEFRTKIISPDPAIVPLRPEKRETPDRDAAAIHEFATNAVPIKTGSRSPRPKPSDERMVDKDTETAKGMHVPDLLDQGAGLSAKAAFDRATAMLADPRFAQVLRVSLEPGKIKIRFQGLLLFQDGRVRLREESLPLLEQLGELIARVGLHVRILGIVATDGSDQPVRRDLYPTTWDLAIARACNVVRFMAERSSLPRPWLGCAAEHPATERGESRSVIIELKANER